MVVRGSTFVLSVLCLWWMPSALHDWLSCSEYSQTTLRVEGEASTSQLPVTTEQVKRVAIIGAGTAGLAALKTFTHDIPKPDGQRWEVELFEQRSSLGGIWLVLRSLSSTLASLADAFSDTGYETMVQLGTHVSQKHHATHNYTQTTPFRQVNAHSCLNTPHAMLMNATYST